MSKRGGHKKKHIVLTSHPTGDRRPGPIVWGSSDPKRRGPVIGTLSDTQRRNAIGAHSGSYALYRALAVAAGSLDPVHRPDFTNTAPAVRIGPFAGWSDPDAIVSLDPWGHMVGEAYAEAIAAGADVRPTIAVTKARLTVAELAGEIASKRLKPDGRVLLESGEVNAT